ncbi:unnamed protein product, partial [Schistosoma turkestanicum]
MHPTYDFFPSLFFQQSESLCCQPRPYFNFTNNSDENDKLTEEHHATVESVNDAAEESDSSTSSYSCPFSQAVIDSTQNCDWNNEALHMRRYDSELIDLRSQLQLPVTREVDDSCIEIVLPPTFTSSSLTTNNQSNELNVLLSTSSVLSSSICDDNKIPTIVDTITHNNNHQENHLQTNQYNDSQVDSTNTDVNPIMHNESSSLSSSSSTNSISSNWRPLLLFVPLRLGLHNPNPCYFNAIKAIFRLPYCIGILGGSPCHAVWIVGVSGDDVICLDPHTTQPTGRGNLKPDYDQTYHCDNPIRMPLKRLDPSMVIGFLCSTEKEFDHLCYDLKQEVLHPSVANSWPLIEIHTTRPINLPPLPSSNLSNDLVLSECPSDEENVSKNVNNSTTDDHNNNHNHKDAIEHEGKLMTDAVGAVKALWSKCNQVAGDTVRSLANVPQRLVKG